MPKYNVTLYPVVMVRLPNIEAASPEEAAEKAEKLLFDARDSVQWPNRSTPTIEWASFDCEFATIPCVDLPDADGDDNLDLMLRA